MQYLYAGFTTQSVQPALFTAAGALSRQTAPTPAEAGGECVVVIVSGAHADESFYTAVEDALSRALPSDAQDFEDVTREYMGGTDNPYTMSATVEARLAHLYRNKSPSKKVLVAAHSLGAIASFNMRAIYGGPYPNTTFLFYDPPYRARGTGWMPPWFPSILIPDIADAIVQARSAGIQDSSETVSWTDGYSEPNDPTEKRRHSRFSYDPLALSRVTDWARQWCPSRAKRLG